MNINFCFPLLVLLYNLKPWLCSNECLWERGIFDELPSDDNDEGGDEAGQGHEGAEHSESDDATCEQNVEKKNWDHFSFESWSHFWRN